MTCNTCEHYHYKKIDHGGPAMNRGQFTHIKECWRHPEKVVIENPHTYRCGEWSMSAEQQQRRDQTRKDVTYESWIRRIAMEEEDRQANKGAGIWKIFFWLTVVMMLTVMNLS